MSHSAGLATEGSRQESTGASSACPWCGGLADIPWRPGTGPEGFQLRRCRGCGLTITVPVLSSEQIAAYYPAAYYGGRGIRFNPLMEALVKTFRRRRAAAICRLAGPGRALDIGCGRGFTLAALRDAGWQVEGVELNASAADYAQDVLKLNVDCRGFHPDAYADSQFDAVILWHVLEHISDVRATLLGCTRILKPHGVLALAVPNLESWQAFATGYGWFHLDLPRHYIHFSAGWLKTTLAELGFEIRQVDHASFEQNPYGWIQSLLNRCGLRYNLLYDILRRGPARVVPRPWRQHPFQSLCSLIGFAVLLLPACAMLIPEALFRRGGTIEIYALRKPASRQ
jgi:SAM-dependent methyltransferase